MDRHESQADVRRLLHDLCVDLGFCLPPEEHRRLCAAPPADVDDFADAVFVAEGLDPAAAEHAHLRARVREVIVQHRGARADGPADRAPGG